MRFQSKYRNHKLMYKPTTWQIMGAGQRIPVPGITVEFTGPQRTFDSVTFARQRGLDDSTREEIEDFILGHPKFGNGVYLAPGQVLPPEKEGKARVIPPQAKRFCREISINENTGEVDQCPNQPMVGKDWCEVHDPDVTRVTKGLSTTK
jgi:hypothetical protein